MNPKSYGEQARAGDLIILGGGCAGLSLAARLAQEAPRLRVFVVEPRTLYSEDRTWCGWRVEAHLFEDCAVRRWPRWRIRKGESVVERGSDRFPYEMIQSDLFYAKAISILEASASCQLLRGLSALSLHETETGVRVTLSDSTCLEAPWVIDTRPVTPKMQPPWLWQNFVGFVVRGEWIAGSSFAAEPTLMDFQLPGDSVARFMYVLPLAAGQALCEWTQFDLVSDQQAEIEARLNAWINLHARSGWVVERRENGSLPMALVPRSHSRRVFPAGTRGGSMRASSGYAFHAIQRWADACTRSLGRSGIPVQPPRSSSLEWMDRLFMQVLQQPGRSAAELFMAMFRETPPDSLVRFLAGLPEPQDLWPIMRSLPWAPFVRALPAALRTRSLA